MTHSGGCGAYPVVAQWWALVVTLPLPWREDGGPAHTPGDDGWSGMTVVGVCERAVLFAGNNVASVQQRTIEWRAANGGTPALSCGGV